LTRAMAITVHTRNIGGLAVDIFQRDDRIAAPRLTVLFILHGRLESRNDVRAQAEHVLKAVYPNSSLTRDLLVVTFDHRNHGDRLVDGSANLGWHRKPERNNPNHAIDMYAVQWGTAQDVSFLIDFLPSYLYPLGGRSIDTWAVAGISLGGHSTWTCLRNDSRISIGIPIIGCPDFLKLMSKRAIDNGLPFGPPTFPDSLLQFIKSTDPAASTPDITSSLKDANPFVDKRILVLSGGADKMVPWEASKAFVEALHVDANRGGVKQVFVQDGVGHECTQEMTSRLAAFVRDFALDIKEVR